MVSTVTPSSDMAPSPRVRIDIDDADLLPGTAMVTVQQISKWGQIPVREAQNRLAVGGLVADDPEIPFGVPVTYKVECLDESGARLGLVLNLTTQIDIPVGMAVVQDPLVPSRAVMLRAEMLFADNIRRSRPTSVYRAGLNHIALSGMRSMLQDVSLRCVTESEEDRVAFDEIVAETLILVRTMPQMRLPGHLYAVVPDTPMLPHNARSGGDADVWDLVGQGVSRPTLEVLVALINYDRFKDYLLATTAGTYDDAMALWTTYIDAMRNPPPEV